MTPPDDELREAVFLAVREAVETSDDLSAQTFRKAADAVLALPGVAALRAKADAADRVRECIDGMDLIEVALGGLMYVHSEVHRALDGPDREDRGRC